MGNMYDACAIGRLMTAAWLLQEVRVLTRESHHRQQMGAPGVFAVLRHMARWANRPDIAAEAASALLNLCYERPHVAAVLEGGGVLLLVACLRRPHSDLQANAAGALQSICFLVQLDPGNISLPMTLLYAPGCMLELLSQA